MRKMIKGNTNDSNMLIFEYIEDISASIGQMYVFLWFSSCLWNIICLYIMFSYQTIYTFVSFVLLWSLNCAIKYTTISVFKYLNQRHHIVTPYILKLNVNGMFLNYICHNTTNNTILFNRHVVPIFNTSLECK